MYRDDASTTVEGATWDITVTFTTADSDATATWGGGDNDNGPTAPDDTTSIFGQELPMQQLKWTCIARRRRRREARPAVPVFAPPPLLPHERYWPEPKTKFRPRSRLDRPPVWTREASLRGARLRCVRMRRWMTPLQQMKARRDSG